MSHVILFQRRTYRVVERLEEETIVFLHWHRSAGELDEATVWMDLPIPTEEAAIFAVYVRFATRLEEALVVHRERVEEASLGFGAHMLRLRFGIGLGLQLGDARLGWSGAGWSSTTGELRVEGFSGWGGSEGSDSSDSTISLDALGCGLRGVVVEVGAEHALSLLQQAAKSGRCVRGLIGMDKLHRLIGAATEDAGADGWLLANSDDMNRGTIGDRSGTGRANGLEVRQEEADVVWYHVLVPLA